MDASEREEAEKAVQGLRNRLKEAGDKMGALSNEHDLLQGEHERLLARHSEMIQDMEAKERLAKERWVIGVGQDYISMYTTHKSN